MFYITGYYLSADRLAECFDIFKTSITVLYKPVTKGVLLVQLQLIIPIQSNATPEITIQPVLPAPGSIIVKIILNIFRPGTKIPWDHKILCIPLILVQAKISRNPFIPICIYGIYRLYTTLVQCNAVYDHIF